METILMDILILPWNNSRSEHIYYHQNQTKQNKNQALIFIIMHIIHNPYAPK